MTYSIHKSFFGNVVGDNLRSEKTHPFILCTLQVFKDLKNAESVCAKGSRSWMSQISIVCSSPIVTKRLEGKSTKQKQKKCIGWAQSRCYMTSCEDLLHPNLHDNLKGIFLNLDMNAWKKAMNHQILDSIALFTVKFRRNIHHESELPRGKVGQNQLLRIMTRVFRQSLLDQKKKTRKERINNSRGFKKTVEKSPTKGFDHSLLFI